MIRFNSLEATALELFLERQKAAYSLRSEIDLDLVLREILRKANEFVPSESGSILLDDPIRKFNDRERNELVFIATFGHGSDELVGQRLRAASGIAGRVYQTGTPYLSENVDEDAYFFSEFDRQLNFKSESIVAVPIYIGKTVCGVLELINRQGGGPYTARDMTLLEIFAGYTSFTLQNALDARRAHELARRDDLTGLFNDRWFHVKLGEAVRNAEESGHPFAVLFLDLDNFKTINDRHGHLAGSQVLREVGFVLKKTVDHPGATVARYGGDEFVVVLPEAEVDSGLECGEKIRSAIEDATFLESEYGLGQPPLYLRNMLSASVGVAAHRPGGDTSNLETLKDDVLRRADSAMYAAKAKGKGRVEIHPEDISKRGTVV